MKIAHVLEMQQDNPLNESYENTSHYWKNDHYANEVIDSLNAPEQWKKCEKDKILEARRSAFSPGCLRNFPPWSR